MHFRNLMGELLRINELRFSGFNALQGGNELRTCHLWQYYQLLGELFALVMTVFGGGFDFPAPLQLVGG